jgi:hypothetical protein
MINLLQYKTLCYQVMQKATLVQILAKHRNPTGLNALNAAKQLDVQVSNYYVQHVNQSLI